MTVCVANRSTDTSVNLYQYAHNHMNASNQPSIHQCIHSCTLHPHACIMRIQKHCLPHLITTKIMHCLRRAGLTRRARREQIDHFERQHQNRRAPLVLPQDVLYCVCVCFSVVVREFLHIRVHMCIHTYTIIHIHARTQFLYVFQCASIYIHMHVRERERESEELKRDRAQKHR